MQMARMSMRFVSLLIEGKNFMPLVTVLELGARFYYISTVRASRGVALTIKVTFGPKKILRMY